jgi:hypothetical protein
MKYQSWRYLLGIVAILVLLTLAMGTIVLAQGGETVYITTPTDGESLAGMVTITGAVDFPDFQKYELYLKTGDEMVWAATVFAPVINGNLAFLDTRTFPDGAYQLIVRMVRNDSNYTEHRGPSFFIENNLGAPLPAPEMDASPLYPPVAGTVARVRNCGGDTLKFDYHSPDGFCSGGSFTVPYKEADSETCPYQDVLLIPCEYRGTAQGEGQPKGASYSFVAEAGRIYELNFPGGEVIYIGEVEGDERASTDTGGLDPNDPARLQPPAVEDDPVNAEAAAVEAEAAPQPAAEATPVKAAPAPADSADASAQADTMLPESGRGTESGTAFVAVAAGLILLLIVGGVVATRKRGFTAW